MPTIRSGLFGLVLAPALALVAFASLWVGQRYSVYASSQALAGQVEAAVRMGELAHALQTERGATTWRLRAGITPDDEIHRLREASDRAADAAKAHYLQIRDAASIGILLEIQTALERLRAEASRGAVRSDDAFGRYSQLIEETLHAIDATARMGADLGPSIQAPLESYAALAHGNEFAGRERAMGAVALAAPRINAPDLLRVAQLQGAQDQRFALAFSATPNFVARWRAFENSAEAQRVLALRAAMVARVGRTSSIEPNVWFAAATERLNALHALENELASEITVQARREMEETSLALAIAIASALAAVLGALAASLVVARWMAAPLERFTTAMKALASGDLDAAIATDSGPKEIRALGGAIEVFRDSMRANETLARDLKESQRLASLGAMVGGIAHEINTPIGNALVVATSLEAGVAGFRDEVNAGAVRRSIIDRHVANAIEASRLLELNLKRAAEQIQSFKQVAVDQTSNQRRRFALGDCLRDAVTSCTPVLRVAGVRAEVHAHDDITMDSYPGGLSQVVVNLIENAVKHGLEGRKDGRIDVVATRMGDDRVFITVHDNGVGVPADLADSVFTAFFTTKAGKGGSGLGLHIVKTIVSTQLGGAITLKNGLEGGALFEINIPVCAPAAQAKETPINAAA